MALGDGATADDIEQVLAQVRGNVNAAARPEIDDNAVESVKFHGCIARRLIERMLEQRLADPDSLRLVGSEGVAVS